MERDGQNGPGRDDVLAFVSDRAGRRLEVWQEADIFAALDLDGAQAERFMADYARTFGVDLAGYEAGFHHRDAARAQRFGWPVAVPHLFGLRLPVPLSTLTDAAQTGRWPLRYPQLVPVPAYDGLNWAIVLIALPLGVGLLLWGLRGFL